MLAKPSLLCSMERKLFSISPDSFTSHSLVAVIFDFGRRGGCEEIYLLIKQFEIVPRKAQECISSSPLFLHMFRQTEVNSNFQLVLKYDKDIC